MTTDAHLILLAGALLAAGVAASVVAARLRLPALVLFLGLGMAIGSDGLGWIDFDNYSLARLMGTIALAVILLPFRPIWSIRASSTAGGSRPAPPRPGGSRTTAPGSRRCTQAREARCR